MHDNSKNNEVLPYIPSHFHSELERLSDQFKKGTQQDCSEFLLSLFNNVEKPSILSEIFEFYTERVIHCEQCRNTSLGHLEPQTILECPIFETTSTLADCLSNYFKKESPTGIDALSCNKCIAKQNVDAQTDMCTMPKDLLISLKRFKANGQAKLHSEVIYPELLHFGEWLYRLSAVIIHLGEDMTSGHYICYVKDEFTNEWFKADDARFTKDSSVLNYTTSVYLLCYERSDHSAPVINDSTTKTTSSSTKGILYLPIFCIDLSVIDFFLSLQLRSLIITIDSS